MPNPVIPRMALETFAVDGYQIPLLLVEHYPLDSQYFVIHNRDDYPIKDYISPHRRKFYKIFHMTSGTGVLTVGLHCYEMGPNEIAFLHPDEIMSWQTTSEETGGHFCLIHPSYFGQEADHVLQLFRQYPNFQADKAVIQLTEAQSATINAHFKIMYDEDRGNSEDKKLAILLQLQMVLLESQRAGRNLMRTVAPEAYGHVYRFLEILESSFQVQGAYVKRKTVAEFADQLHVHPNYLNALVRSHTGKTVRDHIQDRILYEAKSLLVHTDWDIHEIGASLGFSNQAAFTSFFKKKANVTPSVFRKNALNRRDS